MRKLSFFLMLLCFACFGVARADVVEIGDAASTNTQYYLPVNTYFNYSLTQQIYTAEEIGMAGTINSIAFDYAYTNSFTMNGVQVYMMNVDKASFESNTDMVSLANAELVWEGTFSATGSGWVTLELDTPFVYDGTSNLLVCCYDPTNGYPGSAYKFRTTATTDYLGISFHSDSYAPNLQNLSTWNGNKGYYKYRNNITLDITPGASPTCTKPSDMLISNVTPTGATVAWTSDVNNYNFEYKKAFESEWTSMGLAANTYTLTNLTPNTAYSVRVQAVCDTDLTSGWLTSSFSTPASVPLIESFATTSVPTGWTRYIGLLDGVMADTIDLATTSSGWMFTTTNGVFDNHARLNIYGNGCKYWLVTPTLEMEDNVQLDFDLALTKYSGTLAPITDTLGQDDRFVVLVATFGADTTLTILREWNNTGSEYVYNAITCSAVGEHVTFDLSRYAGQNIAIAFYGESTVQETNSDNNLHIDNVSVDYIPACAKPTGVAASGITAHEATLSWVSDAAEWIVAYKATAEEDFTEVTVSETSYSFSGLVPETAYTAKVRANCGGTLSEWSNTANFTTGVACFVPTSFTTSNVTNHGATLNWASEADEWIVAYKATDDTDFTEISVRDTTYTFRTLDPETSYTVKVRANCGDYDGMSAWSITRTFTTLVACPAPNNFTCTAITLTDATLDWNERGDATEWDLQYWKDTDTTLVVVTEKPYTLTNLIAENAYGARVRSACGSNWSSTITFEPTAKHIIGSGTASSGTLPSNTNYNYSYTQQIYTVEELGEAGVFESVDFYMISTNAYTRNLDIYMVNTDKNAFEDNSDWITVTAADLVFSGEVNFAPASWTTITLNNAFIYDGAQNVAIIVDDNTGVYSSRQFRSFTATASQSHYYYRDGSDIVPNEAGTNGSVTASKNQIRILKGEMSSCMKPTHLTATEVGPNFVKLSWIENGEAEQWVVVCNSVNYEASTNEDFMLEGLDSETEYTIYVYPGCDQTLHSDPITITTLAACPVPEEVTVRDTTSNAATVTWVGYNDSYNVQLGQNGEPELLLNVNFEDQAIPTQFVNDTAYAWTIVTDTVANSYYMKSANAGVNSSTSAISVTVTFPANGTVEFDAECRGEGTSTAWDKCIFSIDGVAQFTYGAWITGWNHYSFEVPAGEHTFTWSYTKDSSVNPTGDYFAVDNIVMSSSEIIWADPVSVEDTEYTFTGLTPETNYFVTVTGVCDEVQTEASAIVDFTTTPVFVTSIIVDPNEVDLDVDDIYTISYTVEPADAANPAVTFTSSDEAVATVSETGDVTAVAEGTATITIAATDGSGVTGTFTVNVNSNHPFEREITGYGEDNDGGYVLVASPVSGVNPIDAGMFMDITEPTYDLYRFDQTADLQWLNYKNNQFTLEAGVGYLYASKDDVTITISGTPYDGDGSIGLTYEEGYPLSGFNLIGNPFTTPASIDMPFYKLDQSGSYFDATLEDGNVDKMEGVLVQASVATTWAHFTPVVTKSDRKAVPAASIVVSHNGKAIDKAIIRFDEGLTLGKMQFRESSSKLYFPQNGEEFAIAYAQDGEMPLNFKAEKNGTYTLSFSTENVEMGYLHLIDNLTGNDIDLLATPNYSFEARNDDYVSRFKLVFNAQQGGAEADFAFISNGNIIVNGTGTLQIIDVMGRMLFTHEVYSSLLTSHSSLAPGVYVLRLINGDNARTQKIVIK